MASRDERLLEVLRSLSPPKGGEATGPAGAGAEDEAAPPERAPRPAEAGAGGAAGDVVGAARRVRAIELGLEEVGVFFLAAVLLVVFAFLLGWYGRGLSSPAGSSEGRERTGAAEPPLLSVDASAARDLGTRPSGVTRAPPARATYTLLAARFPPGGEAEAEEHRRYIEGQGFAPAFVRRTTAGIELCVGRFDSHRHPLILEWRPKIRRLRDTYSACHVARIPVKRKVRAGATGPAESGD